MNIGIFRQNATAMHKVVCFGVIGALFIITAWTIIRAYCKVWLDGSGPEPPLML